VVVLSDAVWRTRFGGDSTLVGRTLALDGDPHLVIGVLPPGLQIPHLEWVELWASLPFDPRDEDNRRWRGFQTVARLAPGTTRDAAAAELTAIARRLGELYPETNRDWSVAVLDLRESLVGDVRSRLFVFLGAVGLVLLLGCANLANMTLARTANRTQELAVRSALGATRARLARLLLFESALVSLAGAGLGVALAGWGVDFFVALAPPGIPRLADIGVDWRVLSFALGLTAFTALLIGGVPALQGARADLAPHLHAAPSCAAAGGARWCRSERPSRSCSSPALRCWAAPSPGSWSGIRGSIAGEWRWRGPACRRAPTRTWRPFAGCMARPSTPCAPCPG
jgi:hypothetical protein